jgi:LAS superfamily LD-carboxypeptidase LdcB
MNSIQPKVKRLRVIPILFVIILFFLSGVAFAKFSSRQAENKDRTFDDSTLTPTPTLKVVINEDTVDLEVSSTPTKAVITVKPTVIPTKAPQTNNDIYYMKVDKFTSIGTYAPKDLVAIGTQRVSSVILTDLNKLLADAKKEGLDFKVSSGYRSYSDQEITFNYWVNQEIQKHPGWTRVQAEAEANKYSAKPGYSEHQLGTTVDILAQDTNYEFNSDPNSKSAKWIEANAAKYHFYVSYKYGSTMYNYEPWHIRWLPEGPK